MSVTAALDGTAECEVILKSKDRVVDGFGFIGTPNDDNSFFLASVLPKDLDALNLNVDGSVGLIQFNIWRKGKIDVKINDVVEIQGVELKVRETYFRPEGNYTKIVVKKITRRAVS